MADSVLEVLDADAVLVLHEVGEQGPAGPQGPQGIQGPPGGGMPAGGAAGQVLTKSTSADFDLSWVTPAPGGVTSFNTRLGAVSLTTADVTGALGFAPVPPARQVLAGAGLAGGGDLSADRTLSLPAVGTPGTYGNASNYPVITTDAQGRVTAAGVQPAARAFYNVRDYGAVGDGVADDSPAFAAAMAAIKALPLIPIEPQTLGATLFVPPGKYRLTQTLVIDRSVVLLGASGSGYYGGSWLMFPANTAGLLLHRYNTEPGQPAGSTTGADWSVISDLCILGSGTSNASAHGITMYTRARLRNLFIRGFAGNGISIDTSITPNGAQDLNANNFLIEYCRVDQCHGHGVFTKGINSNIGTILSVDCSNNGGWGFREESFLGNTYVGCHTSFNTVGPYYSTGGVNRTVFDGCYAEQGTPVSQIGTGTLVLGGLLAENALDPVPGQNIGVVLSPRSDGLGFRGGLRAPLDIGGGVTVTVVMALPGGSTPTMWGFGSSDDAAGDTAYRFQYSPTFQRWDLVYAIGSRPLIEFDPSYTNFPVGYRNGQGTAGRVVLPPATAPPATGTHSQGEFLQNVSPTAGGTFGWSCTAGGTPGTWTALNFGGGGAGNPFPDNQALVADNADPTKLLRFDVTGYTTGTTRVVTMPDADFTPAGLGLSQTFTGNQTVAGAQPASVGTTPGTAPGVTLAVTGAAGGNTTIATTGAGGAGAALNLTSGAGGQATAAATASTGGAGGTLNLTGGAGGGAAVAGTGNNTGGAGGAYNLIGGAGGAATGSTTGTNAGGGGGTVIVRAGAGGVASGGAVNNPGAGGTLSLQGGIAAAADGAAGGTINMTSGAGTSTGSGGASGALALAAGNAGGDNTVNRSAGVASLTGGAARGSATGGTVNVTGGVGGPGTGTAGATGGPINVTGGAGGAGSLTGGTGGTVALLGGSAGAADGGAGGAVTVAGNAGTSLATGGPGGNVTLTGGNAGGDNTVNRAGGTVSLNAGASKGSGVGGTVSLNAGAGGVGTGTAGATGGGVTVTPGAGGLGSATGGAGGALTLKGGLGGASTTPGAGGAILFQTSPSNVAVATVLTVSNQGTSTFQPNTTTAGAVVAKGLVSQSGDLFAAQDSSGSVLSRLDKGGYWMTRKTSAPADADLATGEMAIWFTSTAGAAALNVKAKNASGAVVTGSLALA